MKENQTNELIKAHIPYSRNAAPVGTTAPFISWSSRRRLPTATPRKPRGAKKATSQLDCQSLPLCTYVLRLLPADRQWHQRPLVYTSRHSIVCSAQATAMSWTSPSSQLGRWSLGKRLMSSARASRLLARKDVGVCSVDVVGSREVAISCQARFCVLARDSIAHVSEAGELLRLRC